MLFKTIRCRWLLDAGIANTVDDLPQHLGLYISDIHNKYKFELLSTNSAAIGLLIRTPNGNSEPNLGTTVKT